MTILETAPLHFGRYVLGTPLTEEQIRQQAAEYLAHCQAAAGGPDCHPWCKYHDNTEPELNSCHSHPLGSDGDLCLVDERGQWGHLIWWQEGEQKTPDEAEAFAHRILELVALARAGERRAV